VLVRIAVIGATGTIGKAIVEALAERHEVIGLSRGSDPRVDIDDPATIEAFYGAFPGLDAVICAAGNGVFAPLADLRPEDIEMSLRSKLLGQVNLIRLGLGAVAEGGSIIVTSGVLSTHPMPGGSALSLVNGGLEAFVRAAALEAPRGLRINAVSPGWVKETMERLGMDSSPGIPARELAKIYVGVLEGTQTGTVVPS
jgi:NAD(P)-dependent dehydrogenase (short-subunit alcohol dehydrogenase family)